MRKYELTYLISDNVPESDLNKVTGKIGGYVSDSGGKILKEEIWGRRKLAYPIKKQEFATYVTLDIELPAEKANEFEHNLFMSSKIIRHLMIIQDRGEEELVLTTEDIAKTEEIEEVVGGEKSFEVVEGETEESKDLMAKREAEEDEKVKEEESEIKEEAPTKKEDKKKPEEVSKEKEAPKEDKKATKKTPAKESKEKTSKKEASVSKKANKENEADRLSKLDKELDEILGEDL